MPSFGNEEFGQTKSIASLSLGEARKFSFRYKASAPQLPERETADVTLALKPGSLLVMGENCQERYLHTALKGSGERINLTFR